MCGIVGFVGDHDLKTLQEMNQTLVHRGPDDQGFYLMPGVGLAMRRLSIIDVTTGHQPIANEDETVWTVFNGEIYNFRELRKKLSRKGHRFRTDHSDTETIVHAYEEYGPDFVEKLNGMFAIAVWDVKRRRLALYRDRLGEKPLYFYFTGKELFFASEIKAILALPFFKRELNPPALFYYFSLKHAPRDHSFFKGIQSLHPGEVLIFEKGELKRNLYWEIDASKTLKISEKEAADEILRLLTDSVRYRLISDVPLGAYLSGGVDSSSVVGLMSRIRREPMDTFSLTYTDTLSHKEKDQIAALEMSKRFQTRHHEYRLGHEEFIGDLGHIIEAFDEPFGGTVSTYFLSKLISRHVKVAVSGDGADELFGSYKVHRLAYPIYYLNEFIRKGINPKKLTASQIKLLIPFSGQIDYLMSLRELRVYQWHAKLSVYSDEEKNELFDKKWKRKVSGLSIRDYYRKAYARTKTDDPLNQVLQVECQHLLPDQVLNFVDKLSMAHSVEVRPPFLDHRLVEFAFRLPGRFKIKEGVTKFILKQAMKGTLPEDIINRPKEGFILPYQFWMKRYMYDKIKQFISPLELSKHGIFNAHYVTRLVEEYGQGREEHSNRIYLLLMFQIWWRKYFGDQTHPA